MSRKCDYCGETFTTISRMRLHEDEDCEIAAVDEWFVPEPDVAALPDRPLGRDEHSHIENHPDVETVEMAFQDPDVQEFAISVAIEVDGYTYAVFHSPATEQWEITASGEDFDETRWNHIEQMNEEMSRELDADMPSVEVIKQMENLPETITVSCPHCMGEHTAHATFNAELITLGQFEYTTTCDETRRKLTETITTDDDIPS